MVNIKKNLKAYFGLIFLLQYEEMWKKKKTPLPLNCLRLSDHSVKCHLRY